MKKTLITFMALAGIAGATPTAEFHTLATGMTSNNSSLTLNETTGIYTLDTTAGYETDLYTTYQGKNKVYAATSVTLTLNLTAIENATISGNTALLDVSTGTTVGLYLTSSGTITGRWGDGTNGNTVTIDTLLSNDNVQTWEGNKLLTLTAVFNGTNTYPTGTNAGLSLYTADGSCVLQCSGLASENNTTFDAVNFNSAYVAGIMVTPEIMSSAQAGAAATYLQTMVPEPATATLSLLALAGLAARRRRK